MFSQVNAFQLDRLYGLAIDMAQLTAEDEVLDLYCGVGALSIPIAKVVSQLTGVELDEGAVQDATVNATSNKVDNCNFVAADAANVSSWGTPLQRFDLVTVNPPRAGLDPGVIEGIAATRAKRIVYVSCNPETLVRDCKRLTAHHYAVSRVCPVDMFPQTTHVETVVCLERQTKPVGPGVG